MIAGHGRILALKGAGYNVKAGVLDAQWLGVPQTRTRLIFVGVRRDLGIEPAFPKPLSYRYSIRDALPDLVGSLEHPNGFDGHAAQSYAKPTAAIQTSPSVRVRTAKGTRAGNQPTPTVLTHGRSRTTSEMTVEIQRRRPRDPLCPGGGRRRCRRRLGTADRRSRR